MKEEKLRKGKEKSIKEERRRKGKEKLIKKYISESRVWQTRNYTARIRKQL